MTREREQTVHNKLARQVGGAIACLLAAALLVLLSAACARARAREAPALVALLLEEQHRRFPQKSADRFLL